MVGGIKNKLHCAAGTKKVTIHTYLPTYPGNTKPYVVRSGCSGYLEASWHGYCERLGYHRMRRCPLCLECLTPDSPSTCLPFSPSYIYLRSIVVERHHQHSILRGRALVRASLSCGSVFLTKKDKPSHLLRGERFA